MNIVMQKGDLQHDENQNTSWVSASKNRGDREDSCFDIQGKSREIRKGMENAPREKETGSHLRYPHIVSALYVILGSLIPGK